MTTDEKLAKCMEFINAIERTDYWSRYDCFDEDGMRTYRYNGAKYIDIKAIDDVRDKAWHLKADLAD